MRNPHTPLDSMRLSYQVLALAVAILACVKGQTCYFPNGAVDQTATPCNASAAVSHCCEAASLCLNNTYCWRQGDYYTNRISRQSCTDQSWGSSACPFYCADVANDIVVSLLPINNNNEADFCCSEGYNSTSNQCSYATQNSTDPFLVASSSVIFNRTSGSTGSNITTTDTAMVTVTVTALSQATESSSHDAAIGAGVGVPLAAALLGSLFLLWRQRRLGKRTQKKLEQYEAASRRRYDGLPEEQYALTSSTRYGHSGEGMEGMAKYDPAEVGQQPVLAELEMQPRLSELGPRF